MSLGYGCISFDSYIKPQPFRFASKASIGCISFDSYIKPQPLVDSDTFDMVVYLLIPTSNHNLKQKNYGKRRLYIF